MLPVVTVGVDPDPDHQIRKMWGESLRDHMELLGVSRKMLRQRLADERGINVSLQTIDNWVNGVHTLRPSAQVALAALLKVPPHHLFPLDRLPS